MGKTILLWILAIVITLGSMIYQRKTGPNHPVTGKEMIGNCIIDFKLERSHSGDTDQPVILTIPDTLITATLVYKRYKTSDEWVNVPMVREGDDLKGLLPNQPAAGKLEYYIVIKSAGSEKIIPKGEKIITRFNGVVPNWILALHVIFMIFGMLFSTRTGLEALRKGTNIKTYVYLTTAFLFLGGIILGPIVQKYAFGAFWTGFPFGKDLTDNKTLIAMISWLIAIFVLVKYKKARGWIFAASLITFIIYLIPHSLLGSELDYSKMDAEQVQMIDE
ncbi:hypothetical protein JXQ31_20420 [candidate division KSB1 bacterium]|nr:hypothetical protein [candidate division KSB1 bacterium]